MIFTRFRSRMGLGETPKNSATKCLIITMPINVQFYLPLADCLDLCTSHFEYFVSNFKHRGCEKLVVWSKNERQSDDFHTEKWAQNLQFFWLYFSNPLNTTQWNGLNDLNSYQNVLKNVIFSIVPLIGTVWN